MGHCEFGPIKNGSGKIGAGKIGTGKPAKRGMTLVELLTVIVIISVLLAILLPAYNIVRETARVAVCIDHQRQVSEGILQYETQKNHLPGVLSQIATTSGGTAQVNWPQTLMPYIGSQDIWNSIQSGGKPMVRVDLLYCTDDNYLKTNPTQTPLSYVLNIGSVPNTEYFLNYQKTPPVNSSGSLVTPTLTSKMQSTVKTVMLAENASLTSHPGQWGWGTPGTNPAMTYPALTISGTAGAATPPLVSSIPNFKSPHGSVMVMSFFDGHQEKVNVDANFPSP